MPDGHGSPLLPRCSVKQGGHVRELVGFLLGSEAPCKPHPRVPGTEAESLM